MARTTRPTVNPSTRVLAEMVGHRVRLTRPMLFKSLPHPLAKGTEATVVAVGYSESHPRHTGRATVSIRLDDPAITWTFGMWADDVALLYPDTLLAYTPEKAALILALRAVVMATLDASHAAIMDGGDIRTTNLALWNACAALLAYLIPAA